MASTSALSRLNSPFVLRSCDLCLGRVLRPLSGAQKPMIFFYVVAHTAAQTCSTVSSTPHFFWPPSGCRAIGGRQRRGTVPGTDQPSVAGDGKIAKIVLLRPVCESYSCSQAHPMAYQTLPIRSGRRVKFTDASQSSWSCKAGIMIWLRVQVFLEMSWCCC